MRPLSLLRSVLLGMPVALGFAVAACGGSEPGQIATGANDAEIAATEANGGEVRATFAELTPIEQDGLSRETIDRISRSVVRIVTEAGGVTLASGSGTVVESTGLIYTNRHVVEGGDDFVIEVLDDVNERPIPSYRASLVGYALDVDFALLQIDRDADGRSISPSSIELPFLDVFSTDALRGDPIFVFGYPGIGEGYLAFTEGAVTTIRNGTMDDDRMPVWYQTDAQISPGNSGGLAVNARGEIVGIPTAVRSEDVTGGRLGGILAIGAVQAALGEGLESDPTAMAGGTTSPVITDGRLDFSEEPYFGVVALQAGFTPDPHTLDMVSGGEIEADYLGGSCRGYAAMAPDYRLNWSGRSDELRIFFAADDGGDTTLLVNQPDGSWACSDDYGGGLDPMLVLEDPPQGQYDIWVGSYRAGQFIDGMLEITELDLEPMDADPSELDFARDPYNGSVSLRAGFLPDPSTLELVVGGDVDVSYLGSGCVGYATAEPDYRLNWSGSSDELRIFFVSDDFEDATLIVNRPDGSWACNDDAGATLDPMVVLTDPLEGQYDIWIGSYERDAWLSGELSITELDLEP